MKKVKNILNNKIPLFFFALFINCLFWLTLVPLWHFPDEQAHFGQVAYTAITGNKPNGDEKRDLTKEIYVSEILLGTNRDNLGNNRFTFHPGYRIYYTNTFYGEFEASISSELYDSSREDFVYKEISRYPELFYRPAALIYKILNNQDLFIRVYAVRIFSIILFISNIYLVYLFGKLIFDKEKLMTVILPLLVGFHPMMVFANVGVNSDSLGNLLFTAFLFISVKIIIKGINWKIFLTLLISSILCVYVKPQFIVSVPIVYLLSVFVIIRDISRKYRFNAIIFSLIMSLFLIIAGTIFYDILPSYIRLFFSKIDLNSLLKYTMEYSIPHTYREVMPWYWGVYDWLGVTYPRLIHRIINLIILLSTIGMIKLFYISLRKRKFRIRKYQAGIYLFSVSVIFYTAIIFYDWLSWSNTGYQLGIQGRYFFPLIGIQMLFILLGWREIFGLSRNLRTFVIKILSILMMTLNIYALYTVAKAYYDLSSWRIFIIQVSQYKPWFIKNNGFTILIIIFIISQLLLALKIYKHSDAEIKTTNQDK
jgi:hypothetical protein